MHFEPNQLYHIYNLGINTQPIFFAEKNYRYFLEKIKIEWLPYADIIAYTLLPTEIHFIVRPNEYACVHLEILSQVCPLQKFSVIIGCTLSSYTKAINKDLNRKGCLFHKKTKCTQLELLPHSKIGFHDAAFCMTLIHQKAVRRGLCKKPTQWKFSSSGEYYLNKRGICSKAWLLNYAPSQKKEERRVRKILRLSHTAAKQ